MAYCDECGFYMDSAECEMCDSHLAHVESQLEARAENAERPQQSRPTSTWWRGVAITPFLLLAFYYFASQYAEVPLAAYSATLLFYSFAIIFDVRYVRKWTTGWNPNPTLWALLAAFNILCGGVFTFFLTPWYLYKRRRVTPVPTEN